MTRVSIEDPRCERIAAWIASRDIDYKLLSSTELEAYCKDDYEAAELAVLTRRRFPGASVLVLQSL